MPELKVGEPAPDFALSDATGRTVKLSDFRGRKVVLYFYPRDNTPGCTKEACDFRDNHARFADAGAVVIGISPDSAKSHEKFAAKFGLPFILLADPDHQVATRYGVWKEKSLMGKIGLGVERSTFLIDEEGRLAQEFRKVKVNGHVDLILNLVD